MPQRRTLRLLQQALGLLVTATIMTLSWVVQAHGQELAGDEDFERERLELLNRWKSTGLAKPRDVEVMAKQILARPLQEQAVEDLEHLARQSTTAAYFVHQILIEYGSYYRSMSSRYVGRHKLWTLYNAYSELTKRLGSYRNRAYFNLGRKAMERGEEIEAFFYFRDAYRLSEFREGDDAEEGRQGLRYRSEIEMKKLLEIDELGSYDHWDDS